MGLVSKDALRAESQLYGGNGGRDVDLLFSIATFNALDYLTLVHEIS